MNNNSHEMDTNLYGIVVNLDMLASDYVNSNDPCDFEDYIMKNPQNINREIRFNGWRGTPLNVALRAVRDNIPFIESLLESGANVDYYDSDNLTPLMRAFKIEEFNLLVKHGANINSTNIYGYTALHIFASYGRYDLIREMRIFRVIHNPKTDKGRIPFDDISERINQGEWDEKNNDIIDYLRDGKYLIFNTKRAIKK